MNDKERLQTIKDQFEWGEENLESGIYNLESDDINWLIEQAERVQRCQESYSGLNKMYDHWRNKAKELEKQLQQAQAKAEKYENALREIDTHIRSTSEPVSYIIQTLKETLPEYTVQALEGSS
jgi:predicted  nucleic acid-binding Zn-ribbon protein